MKRLCQFGLLLGLLLVSHSPAYGFGWGLFRSSSYYYPAYYSSSSYYYPTYTASSYYYPSVSYYTPTVSYYAPTVSYYVPTVSYYVPSTPVYYVAPTVVAPTVVAPVAACAVPAVTSTPAVVTRPAPLLANPIPAPASQPSTSRSSGTQVSYYNAPADGERVRVGFWNVSGREVVLQVNGAAYTLAAGRAVTLSVPRQFVWQVDQNQAQSEAVPASRSNYEIVIR